MVPAPVKVAGCVFLVVWGGLCAALIGLAVYHSIVDLAARIWPRRGAYFMHPGGHAGVAMNPAPTAGYQPVTRAPPVRGVRDRAPPPEK